MIMMLDMQNVLFLCKCLPHDESTLTLTDEVEVMSEAFVFVSV